MSVLRTNKIYPRDGLPAGASGGIIQMKQTVLPADVSTTSTSFTDASGFSVTITPTSASNKILVVLSCRLNMSSGSNTNTRGSISVFRDATNVVNQFAGVFFGGVTGNDFNAYHSVNTSYLDSPATTSSITYQVKFASDNSACTTSINGGSSPPRSYLTVMEVSG